MNSGNITHVLNLIENGINLNAANNGYSETHVHETVFIENDEDLRGNKYQILKILISHGAHFDDRDHSG